MSGQDDTWQDHVTDDGFGQMDSLQGAPTESEETKSTPLNEGTILHSFECSGDKTETDLSDDSYTSDVLKNLDEARKNGDFCDITLLIGPDKHPIKAHRLILASASEYFRAMFTAELKEGGQSEVVLPNIDLATMKSLMDFVYTGKLKVSNENIEKIVTAANFFGLSKIVEKCTKYIKEKMDKNNSIEILEFAERISNRDLKYGAFMFILQNFEAITSKNLDIMGMSTLLLLTLIAANGISIHQDPTENEERLFQLGWNHLQTKSAPDIEKFLPDLLRAVHLPRVSDEFLQNLTRKSGNNETVSAILEQAKHVKSKFTSRANLPSDLKNINWAMNRFRNAGTLSVTCEGFRNDTSLEWSSVPVFINGISLFLRVRIFTNTDNGPPTNYLSTQCILYDASTPKRVPSLPCTIKFSLLAPKNSPQNQDFEIGGLSHTFTAAAVYTRLWGIKKVTEVLAEYYDLETESCTVRAQIDLGLKIL